MAGIEWKRARWTVLYILSTHGDTHLYEIQRIAQERFGIEVTAYMMRKFRRPHGILHWDYDLAIVRSPTKDARRFRSNGSSINYLQRAFCKIPR